LAASGGPVAPTAFSVEEVLRGWLSKIASTRQAAKQVRYYDLFQADVQALGRGNIVPFDERAAAKFDELRTLKLGVGTLDMKIAAIVLVIDGRL
jgi:tRNA(fMet)-specific endonuclease VapC